MAGRAITVPAPVPEGLCGPLELGIIGEDGTAFAHGDVVCRIKAQGGDVAKRPHQLAVVGAAKRIAAVFDKPEAMLFAYRHHGFEVEGVAQRMGNHDGLGLGGNCRFYGGGIDVVGGDVHIDEDRYCAGLKNGVDRGGESSGDGNDFIAGLYGPGAQLRGRQGGEGNQVGRGSGIDGQKVLDAQVAGHAAFKFRIESSRCQPAIQAGRHHVLQFRGTNDLARNGHGRQSRKKGLGRMNQAGVFLDQFQNVLPDFLGRPAGRLRRGGR